jgi:hypothetical protein
MLDGPANSSRVKDRMPKGAPNAWDAADCRDMADVVNDLGSPEQRAVLLQDMRCERFGLSCWRRCIGPGIGEK